MKEKTIMGMIHLKALPTAPNHTCSIQEITDFALEDLKRLEEAGVTHAIVENLFDTPYSTELNLETIVAYTHVFTILKEKAMISLGVNIHATSGVEEMVVATICGADFIRAESFVEMRAMMSGFLQPMAAGLMRKKKEMNSSVKIFADVNVKESRTVISQDIEVSIDEAIKAGADAIIVTGLETGKPPSSSEVKQLKEKVKDKPLFIGSGVNEKNIKELMKYADGAIVGSSIKEDGKIYQPISKKRTLVLLKKLDV